MLVDIHGHIASTGNAAAPAARLSLYASACKLDFVLVSNVAAAPAPRGANLDEVDANLASLQACREHARLAPLYWIRPGQLDSHVPAVVGALRTAPFVGAAFAPTEGGFDAADSLLDPYLAALETIDRPAVFCVSAEPNAAPPKVIEAARRHPRTKIVLCLCGAAETPRAAALDAVAHALRQQKADVYLDTSHATSAEIVAAVRAIGSDRVLFGTDAVRRSDAHVPRHIAVLDELRKSLAAKDFQAVSGGNAVRLFGLKAPAR